MELLFKTWQFKNEMRATWLEIYEGGKLTQISDVRAEHTEGGKRMVGNNRADVASAEI